jgi:hypothetical protein
MRIERGVFQGGKKKWGVPTATRQACSLLIDVEMLICVV